jgi:hypothetical protein
MFSFTISLNYTKVIHLKMYTYFKNENLEAKLNNPSCTVEELLDETCIVQEMRKQNPKLFILYNYI